MSQLRRDLHRLLSVPTPWILLAIEIFLAVGISGSTKLVGIAPSPTLALGFLPAIAGVFGAVSAGADFRFGALPGEILALGGPLRYFLRMFAAVFTVATTMGALGAASAGATWAVLQHPAPGPTRIAALVCAGMAASAGWAVLGAALAVATRSQIGAVTAVLAYLMFIEPVLEVSGSGLGKVLPGHVAVGLFGAESVTAVAATGYHLVVPALVLAGLVGGFAQRRALAVTAA